MKYKKKQKRKNNRDKNEKKFSFYQNTYGFSNFETYVRRTPFGTVFFNVCVCVCLLKTSVIAIAD